MTLNFVMVARTLDFVFMSHMGNHILTGLLPAETLRDTATFHTVIAIQILQI